MPRASTATRRTTACKVLAPLYVFRRFSSGWRQEAYLKAGVIQPQQFFGGSFNFGHESLALNADGTLLAVGASEQDVNGIQDTGAVYVYQRSSSGRWSLVATLTAPSPSRLELFGYSVDMSLDGRTMKINSFGTRDGPDGKPRFRTYIYVRPDTTWQYSATLTGISRCRFLRYHATEPRRQYGRRDLRRITRVV